MKPVFVIMVTYRRFEQFKATVESLLPTLPRFSTLAIINNGNDQETYNYMVKLATAPGAVKIKLLDAGGNNGWGSAMNEGLDLFPEWKDYQYVLESNNDVTYTPGWAEKAVAMMEAHPEIGILGLFKHPYHGVRQELPDGLVIKDDMPATAWFMRSMDLQAFLPFPEHGPCNTRGGNGEDVGFRMKVQETLGRWICGMKEDLAHHMDGYDIPDLGKPNPAYE